MHPGTAAGPGTARRARPPSLAVCPSTHAEAPTGGRTVVLGVTGGIAAYKAVEVCRRLVDAGVHVAPVLTRDATRFVGEVTFSALASEPARTSLWGGGEVIPHTRLGRQADLVVVAPATARLIGLYAAGISSDLLTATLIATRAPVLVCPAMHGEMWEHPAVQDNVARLAARGVHFVGPENGRLAGGDEGPGRMADPAAIVSAALALLENPPAGCPERNREDLAGVRIVVSAGGTREPIDPVRFIANRSTGKQGHALAAAAHARGADVVLVTAAGVAVPAGVRAEHVETVAEMEEAVVRHAQAADVVVMAAAVADFRPKTPHAEKIHKRDGVPEIVLEPAPDILAELSRLRRDGQVLVGFAAETAGGDDLVERARAKLAAKGADVVVANDVREPGAGFGHDTNAVVVVDAAGGVEWVPLSSKVEVSHRVLDKVVGLRARRGM